MAISLPEKPDGKEYEDYVCACLVALGYFTESRMILRKESTEILELDIVATPSGKTYLQRMLCEAKSGKWGFHDLFKVLGWTTYLGITRGCIVSPTSPSSGHEKAARAIARRTGVSYRVLPVMGDDITVGADACTDVPKKLRLRFAANAWYKAISERLAFIEFTKYCKSNPDSPVVQSAREYERALHNSFFGRSPVGRVRNLYEAYSAAPNISGQCVALLAGRAGCSERDIWNKVNDTSDHLWVQYVMLLEHKARNAIIKNALDYALIQGKRKKTKAKAKTLKARLRIAWAEALARLLPQSFKDGMEELRKHEHAKRIPYLFHVFVEYMGGFYGTGDADDIELLAQLTEIPADKVVACLEMLNVFFPFTRGWFFAVKGELVCMKMTPGFMRGAGCFFRHSAYKLKDYEDRYPQMGWLLAKWHNAIYAVLEPYLKTVEST